MSLTRCPNGHAAWHLELGLVKCRACVQAFERSVHDHAVDVVTGEVIGVETLARAQR